MDIRFEHNLVTRDYFRVMLETMSLEKLNKIPSGYSNNIIWNIAHCIVVQQGLTYGLSGVDQLISKDMVAQYKHGTKPERNVTGEEVTRYKNLLQSTMQQTQMDYKAGNFASFKKYTTSTGYTLMDIDQAISLINIHDGIHLGYVLALKRALDHEE